MTSIIPGRSRENARKVLAAAEAAGVDPIEVRTVEKGYSVPDKVAEKYLELQRGDEPAQEPAAEGEEQKAEKPKRNTRRRSTKTAEAEPSEENKAEANTEAEASDPEKGDD